MRKEWLIILAKYLGETLGADYEIVIHSINEEKIENSEIIAIENAHISNRTISSPLTDFALDMIKNKDYEKIDFKTNYKALTSTGTEIRGSTLFIKDEDGKIKWILCINHNISKIKQITKELADIFDLEFSQKEKIFVDEPSTEILTSSIEDTIYSVIDPVFLEGDVQLSPKQKEKVIGKLYENGVFSMKGSVHKVAKTLGISEPTVYRYLKSFW